MRAHADGGSFFCWSKGQKAIYAASELHNIAAGGQHALQEVCSAAFHPLLPLCCYVRTFYAFCSLTAGGADGPPEDSELAGLLGVLGVDAYTHDQLVAKDEGEEVLLLLSIHTYLRNLLICGELSSLSYGCLLSFVCASFAALCCCIVLLLLLLIGVAWVLRMLFVSRVSSCLTRGSERKGSRRRDGSTFIHSVPPPQGMISTRAFFSFFALLRLFDCWCSSRRESARCLTLCTAVLFCDWVLYLYRKQC